LPCLRERNRSCGKTNDERPPDDACRFDVITIIDVAVHPAAVGGGGSRPIFRSSRKQLKYRRESFQAEVAVAGETIYVTTVTGTHAVDADFTRDYRKGDNPYTSDIVAPDTRTGGLKLFDNAYSSTSRISTLYGA
jgi:hypothetical protein